MRGLFITATDTDVGKTYVAAGLAAAIQKQFQENNSCTQVKLWKPVQSGAIVGDCFSDSYRLAHGSGLNQPENEMVTFSFKEPRAPLIAAQYEGKTIDWQALLQAHQELQVPHHFVMIEGAGGLMVPLTSGQLVVDLAVACGYPLIIVARPGLGTVNHTLLTIHQARAKGLLVQGIILNGCIPENDSLIRENAAMIESFGHVPVIGLLPKWHPQPMQANLSRQEESFMWQTWRESWTAMIEQQIQWSKLWDES